MLKIIKNSVSTLLAVTLLSGASAAFAISAAGAYLTLNSFSGHPGITLQVSGGGLTAGETVTLYLNNTSTASVGTATVQADTTFGPVGVVIPANTPQGSLTVIGVSSLSHQTISNAYYVNPFTPTITVTNTVNTPLSVLNIDGSGFAPNETVNFALSTGTGSATANASGNFTGAHFTIPNVSSQTYPLTATGAASGAQALNYFYVGGFYPTISPSTYYILPSQQLSFSGSGFANSETIQVFEGASVTPLSTITAATDGSFTAAGAFAVPFNFVNSSRTFNLVGQSSHAHASTTITVGQFFPAVSPSSYYIAPNNQLSFTGSGFASNEAVRIYEGIDLTHSLGSLTADATGAFTNAGAITVPYTFAGSTRTFRLIGQASAGEGDVNVTVGQFYPSITPSAYYINPGQSLTVSGNSFAPHEIVDITLGGSTPTSVTANALGIINSGAITVPYTSLPYLTITAFGESSHATTTSTLTMGSYFASVAPSSWYLLPGSTVNFTGTGFAPSENVSLTATSGMPGVTTNVTTVTSDPLGNITTSAVVPFGVNSIAYAFTGALSHANTTLNISIASLMPGVSADNYYALPGSIVHVTGTGFAAGETVTATAGTFSTHVIADSHGSTAAIPVTIPFGGDTTITITLTGSTSHVSASTIVTLASFYPSVSPSTYYTSPGTHATFTGTGFAANETVNFTLNGTAAGHVTADAMGNVSGGFTIPFSAHGTAHMVFTGTSSTASVPFDIGLSGFYAGIILDNYYAVGGTHVTITGNGFAPNEVVDLNFGGASVGTATADTTGSFTQGVSVPYSGTTGSKIVRATGETSAAVASTTFTQAPVYVSVSLGAYAGAPGDHLTFIGSGFLPNEPVNITTDRTGSTVVYTFNAAADGSFSNAGYALPTSFTGGPLSLTIIGTHSLTPQSITYYVTGP